MYFPIQQAPAALRGWELHLLTLCLLPLAQLLQMRLFQVQYQCLLCRAMRCASFTAVY